MKMFFYWSLDQAREKQSSSEDGTTGEAPTTSADTVAPPHSTPTGSRRANPRPFDAVLSASSSPKRRSGLRSGFGTPKQVSLTDEELSGWSSSPEMTPSTSFRALGATGHLSSTTAGNNASMRSRLLDFHFTNHIKATIGKDGQGISSQRASSPFLQKTQSLDIEPQQLGSGGGGRYSPGLVSSSLSVTNLASDDPEPGKGSEKLGRIQFSVAYDFPETTLTLRVIRAVDLPAKDFSGTSDPYVKVMLLPDKKRKLTTNIKRKNLNPRWNEVFAFEGFPYNKLMNRTLYMQVLDYDRFSRDDPIGEVCIPLGDLDLASGHTLWKNLQPCKGHTGKLGELYTGLCYQPTVGRITIIIHQARELKAKDINGLSDPYVKVWLCHEGKKVEKKKTVVIEKSLNPVFNESFVFDVPYERIRQTSLSVSVMDYDRMGRNERIGQVVLGAKSGPMEVKHWNEMFSKARQAVSQWHVLKDFG